LLSEAKHHHLQQPEEQLPLVPRVELGDLELLLDSWLYESAIETLRSRMSSPRATTCSAYCCDVIGAAAVLRHGNLTLMQPAIATNEQLTTKAGNNLIESKFILTSMSRGLVGMRHYKYIGYRNFQGFVENTLAHFIVD